VVTRITHSMTELCAALDEKIAYLADKQATVKGKLKSNIGVEMNTDALQQITKSLEHAREARYAAEQSCCGYTCDVDYQE
jgi:hypothetical protein